MYALRNELGVDSVLDDAHTSPCAMQHYETEGGSQWQKSPYDS